MPNTQMLMPFLLVMLMAYPAAGTAQNGSSNILNRVLNQSSQNSPSNQSRNEAYDAAQRAIEQYSQSRPAVKYSAEQAQEANQQEQIRQIDQYERMRVDSEFKARIEQSITSTFQRMLTAMIHCRETYDLVRGGQIPLVEIDGDERVKALQCADIVDSTISSNSELIEGKAREFETATENTDGIVGFDGFLLGENLLIATLLGNPANSLDGLLNIYPVMPIKPTPIFDLFDNFNRESTKATTGKGSMVVVAIESTFTVQDRGTCSNGITQALVDNFSERFNTEQDYAFTHNFHYTFTDKSGRTIYYHCDVPGTWNGPEGITRKKITFTVNDNAALQNISDSESERTLNKSREARSADLF